MSVKRRKLTDEERHFRKIGSGIPISRWWPIFAIFVAVIIAVINSDYVARCLGVPFDEFGSRRGFRIAWLLAYPCSPLLLRDGINGWLIFFGLWTPWPFAFVNWRWAKRQRQFWDGERLREAERRKKKRQAKALDLKS